MAEFKAGERITAGAIVFAVDGVAVRGISEVTFTEVPRQRTAPPPGLGEYRASGTITMSRQQCNLLMAAVCPHGKAARRLVRARFKALRRAYLAAKVPRSRCMCSPLKRTRAGDCAAPWSDPDGNRFCSRYERL